MKLTAQTLAIVFIFLSSWTAVVSAENVSKQLSGTVMAFESGKSILNIDGKTYQIDNEVVWHEKTTDNSANEMLIRPLIDRSGLESLIGQRIKFVVDAITTNPPRIAEIWLAQ